MKCSGVLVGFFLFLLAFCHIYCTFAGDVLQCDVPQYSNEACSHYESDHCKVGSHHCSLECPLVTSGNNNTVITIAKGTIGNVVKIVPSVTQEYIQFKILNPKSSDGDLYLVYGDPINATLTCCILNMYGPRGTPVLKAPEKPVMGILNEVSCVLNTEQPPKDMAIRYNEEHVKNCNMSCIKEAAHTYIAELKCKILWDTEGVLYCIVTHRFERTPVRSPNVAVTFKKKTTAIPRTTTKRPTTSHVSTEKKDEALPPSSNNVDTPLIATIVPIGIAILVVLIAILSVLIAILYNQRKMRPVSVEKRNSKNKEYKQCSTENKPICYDNTPVRDNIS